MRSHPSLISGVRLFTFCPTFPVRFHNKKRSVRLAVGSPGAHSPLMGDGLYYSILYKNVNTDVIDKGQPNFRKDLFLSGIVSP